jgi:hypothetical protein
LSWETAASNIQDAVNAATEGATVWVGPGTYTMPPNATNYQGTNVVYINKPLILRSSTGAENTIVDGGGTNRGIAFYYDKAPPKMFVIDGFTVSNCWATNAGGGIHIYYLNGYGTSVVQNCIISDNVLDTANYSWGAGVYAYAKNAPAFGFTMSNCVVRRNQAKTTLSSFLGVGGGICAERSNVRITGCTIEDNKAGLAGGILLNTECYSPLVENCTIRRNFATKIPNANDSRSGGLEMRRPGTVRNCLLAANKSETAYADQLRFQTAGTYYMENCTVVDGVGVAGGSAVYLAVLGINLVCVNSIVCSNSLNLAVGSRTSIGGVSGSYMYITNSFVMPLPTGSGLYSMTNSITTGSAAFVDFSGSNFRLTKTSPCVNTGTNLTTTIGALDLDGRPRISPKTNGTVDMGAYEYVFSSGTLMLVQ